jgi:hypothetical protein
MKKVIGRSILTHEELVNLMTDIEAVINSRPLVPVSDDANDLEALTPNMLLTGKRFRSMPLAEPVKLATSQLSNHPHQRWLHVNSLAAIFGKRWSHEYLTTLQRREKWCTEQPSLKVGDLVLVTDELHPPLQWPLGRVMNIFTGNDDVTRVVNVKTHKGLYKRCATKLRLLPIRDNRPEPPIPDEEEADE